MTGPTLERSKVLHLPKLFCHDVVPPSMMNKMTLLLSMAIVVPLALGLVGCTSSTDDEGTGGADGEETSAQKGEDEPDPASTSQASRSCKAHGVQCAKSSDCCEKFCARKPGRPSVCGGNYSPSNG